MSSSNKDTMNFQNWFPSAKGLPSLKKVSWNVSLKLEGITLKLAVLEKNLKLAMKSVLLFKVFLQSPTGFDHHVLDDIADVHALLDSAIQP